MSVDNNDEKQWFVNLTTLLKCAEPKKNVKIKSKKQYTDYICKKLQESYSEIVASKKDLDNKCDGKSSKRSSLRKVIIDLTK